jgi:hypothetical protein
MRAGSIKQTLFVDNKINKSINKKNRKIMATNAAPDPKDKKKKLVMDSFKAIMPIAVPYAVKMLMNLVPEGSKVEDFFMKYKENWGKVAPAVTTLILQVTNMPEYADDIVAELSAEVARTIKEKYSDGDKLKNTSSEKAAAGSFPISFAMTSLTKDELVGFTGLVQSLPEKQRKKILALEVGSKDDTKAFIKTLVTMEEVQFKMWADVMSPVEQPKTDTALEKGIKDGWNEFTDDSKSYFQKDSYFVRLAKSRGLM